MNPESPMASVPSAGMKSSIGSWKVITVQGGHRVGRVALGRVGSAAVLGCGKSLPAGQAIVEPRGPAQVLVLVSIRFVSVLSMSTRTRTTLTSSGRERPGDAQYFTSTY